MPADDDLLFRYAESTVPTVYGPLTVVLYRVRQPDAKPSSEPFPAQNEHMALIVGEIRDREDVLCRVHCECWTGEVLGSLKCDCRDQLDAALKAIVGLGRGVVVYLRQEGRGIGLGNKIRAYALQGQGADTLEANEALGFAWDLRSYGIAATILRDLGVSSVALMTNNPDKLRQLRAASVRITRRVPHWGAEVEHNREYLQVKRQKLGHYR